MKNNKISYSAWLFILLNVPLTLGAVYSKLLEKGNASFKLSSSSNQWLDDLRNGVCNTTVTAKAQENFLRVWTLSARGIDYAWLDRALNNTPLPEIESCLYNYSENAMKIEEHATDSLLFGMGLSACFLVICCGFGLTVACCFSNKEDKKPNFFQNSNSHSESGATEDTQLLSINFRNK